jgi:hypothetical protein
MNGWTPKREKVRVRLITSSSHVFTNLGFMNLRIYEFIRAQFICFDFSTLQVTISNESIFKELKKYIYRRFGLGFWCRSKDCPSHFLRFSIVFEPHFESKINQDLRKFKLERKFLVLQYCRVSFVLTNYFLKYLRA